MFIRALVVILSFQCFIFGFCAESDVEKFMLKKNFSEMAIGKLKFSFEVLLYKKL